MHIKTMIAHALPDRTYIAYRYRTAFGKRIDLKNPKSFNEKLQWLKLYDRNPLYTTMVDKYEAKKYVAGIIGEQHIIPTLGVWDSFDAIDFDSLQERFVLKCTHDSGGIVIVKDKSRLDRKAAKAKLEESLATDFYKAGREWPYKNVKRRIIAEQYMEEKSGQLHDYKFFCFSGEPKLFKVDFDRYIEHRANYFDMEGKLQKIGEVVCPPDFSRTLELPATLPLMQEFAKKLSEKIPFVRVDFYDVDGNVYFGELTLYPASGFGRFLFDGNDELLGSWIRLEQA